MIDRSSKFRVVSGLLILTCLTAMIAGAPKERIPVILSTDVGNEVDDQWTIVYLLVSEELDIRGIVSAHAPTIAPPAGQTGLMLLRQIAQGRLNMAKHPPLFAGADLPLENRNTPRESEGISFLIDASRDFSPQNRLNVLMIGAATDVASAILKDPTIVDRIKVISMGFKSWTETPQGEEFNIQNDPAAVQVILDSAVPFVAGAGDICRKHLSLSLDEAKALVGNEGPVGRWLWDEFLAWYYRFIKPRRVADYSRPWIIWDNITLAYLLGMTEQQDYVRPRMDDTLIFQEGDSSRKITWITKVDQDRMWADFIRKLNHYQRTHPVYDLYPAIRHTFGMP